MRAAVGITAWLLSFLAAYLVPAEYARAYGTLWAGLTTLVMLYFVAGYVRFSRPTKDPKIPRAGSVWAWVLAQSLMFLIVFGNTVWVRLATAPPLEPTPEQVLAWRSTAAIYATAFFVQGWIALVWTKQQIRMRKERNLNAR
jgi:hypothetical protein